MKDIKCHCGQDLHYTDPEIRRQLEKLVADLGEFIPVTVSGVGTFQVQRHYIALHGIKGKDISSLGFKKIK